jgi:hypothetical protein
MSPTATISVLMVSAVILIHSLLRSKLAWRAAYLEMLVLLTTCRMNTRRICSAWRLRSTGGQDVNRASSPPPADRVLGTRTGEFTSAR